VLKLRSCFNYICSDWRQTKNFQVLPIRLHIWGQ